MAPNSPVTARRVYMMRQEAEQKAARALRNIQHELRKSLKKLREHTKERKKEAKILSRSLFGKTVHRQQLARSQIVRERRMVMNMNILKSILGNFKSLENMNHKYSMYMSGAAPHGYKLYNVDPRAQVLYTRIRPHVVQTLQQQARQSNAHVAQLRAQIAALEHQARAVSTIRPRI